VPVLFVRHAVAVGRRRWDDDDLVRPLSKRGRRQAGAIADRLAAYPLSAVLSSPAVRCVETVSPLGEAMRLSVERRDELAEGAGREAVDFVRGLLGQTVALCSHGDVIPDLLHVLRAGSTRIEDPLVWPKASAWLVTWDGTHWATASYLAPPQL